MAPIYWWETYSDGTSLDWPFAYGNTADPSYRYEAPKAAEPSNPKARDQANLQALRQEEVMRRGRK